MLIRQLDGMKPLAAHASDGISLSAPRAAAVATADALPPAPPNRGDAETAVAQANRALRSVAPSLEFVVDPDTEIVVIRLVDRVDREVLRQVPSAEMLDIARALDKMQSLLLRYRA